MVPLASQQTDSKHYHINNGSVIISSLASLVLAGYCATQPVNTKSVLALGSSVLCAIVAVIKATQLQKDYAIFRRTQELKMAVSFYRLEEALVPVEMTSGYCDEAASPLTAPTSTDILTGRYSLRTSDSIAAYTQPTPFSLKRYLVDEATGILICGNSGAGKTSAALEICGMLTEENPAQVIVLDPHFNDQWEQAGLYAISRIEEVEQAISSLVKELDARHERKRLKLPNGSKLIIITDELLSCKKRFKTPKLVGDALTRLSTEGRKRDMLFIGISHSPNADDLEISAEVRTSFAVIKLCKSAQKHVANYWEKDDPRKAYILNHPGYPAIVADGVEQVIEHPTHAHYYQFKKNGNEPKYQHRIHQLEWTTLNPDGSWKAQKSGVDHVIVPDSQNKPQPSAEPKPSRPHRNISRNIDLEKPPDYPPLQPQVSLEDLLLIIWKYANLAGEVTVREIQRKWDIGQKYRLSSETIAYFFGELQNRGWGDKIEASSLGKISFKPQLKSCPDSDA